MGKPFRITQPTNDQARDDGGRFMPRQPVAPAPPQVVDSARAAGRSVDKQVADERVPDHPTDDAGRTPSGGNREQNPWPPAQLGHKPMRVG